MTNSWLTQDSYCYFLRSIEEFSLAMVIGSRATRYRIVSIESLLNQLWDIDPKAESTRLSFLIASLVLSVGDGDQRELIHLWQAKSSRNITSKNVVISTMLVEGLKEYLEENAEIMTPDRLQDILATTLTALKVELGLPVQSPCRWSYTIDDLLLVQLDDSDTDQKCKAFLERYRTSYGEQICCEQFENLEDELNTNFQDSAKKMIESIKATKSQDHLTAISLIPQGGISNTIFVSLANACGHSLIIEDWKFVRLLEHLDQAHRIGELVKKSYRERDVETPFAFNANATGEVLAKFIPKSATIYVRCRDKTTFAVVDQAEFILDIDYALCLYVTLKQLREDRERFNRLKEQADTKVDCDLFDNLPFSTCNRSDHE